MASRFDFPHHFWGKKSGGRSCFCVCFCWWLLEKYQLPFAGKDVSNFTTKSPLEQSETESQNEDVQGKTCVVLTCREGNMVRSLAGLLE